MPPKKTINRDGELFNINGLSVKENAVYKIENRYDATAPSGFREHNSTKLPSTNVGNSIQCPFIVTNSATNAGIWDTGLFEESPCYRGEDQARVKERIKVLNERIVKPFEKLKGSVGVLNHSNDEFWNSYSVDLWAGRYFYTNNAEDMLDLYIAMQAGEMAIETDQGNPRYNGADFIIVDKEKEKTAKQKKAVSNVSSIGRFYVLLQENPKKLSAVLRYVGVANITDKVNETTLMTNFSQWLDLNEKNAETFERILDGCEDKAFEETIYLYQTLKTKVKGLTKNGQGDFVYNGIPLGKDLKQVAKNLVFTDDLSDIKAQILESAGTLAI